MKRSTQFLLGRKGHWATHFSVFGVFLSTSFFIVGLEAQSFNQEDSGWLESLINSVLLPWYQLCGTNSVQVVETEAPPASRNYRYMFILDETASTDMEGLNCANAPMRYDLLCKKREAMLNYLKQRTKVNREELESLEDGKLRRLFLMCMLNVMFDLYQDRTEPLIHLSVAALESELVKSLEGGNTNWPALRECDKGQLLSTVLHYHQANRTGQLTDFKRMLDAIREYYLTTNSNQQERPIIVLTIISDFNDDKNYPKSAIKTVLNEIIEANDLRLNLVRLPSGNETQSRLTIEALRSIMPYEFYDENSLVELIGSDPNSLTRQLKANLVPSLKSVESAQARFRGNYPKAGQTILEYSTDNLAGDLQFKLKSLDNIDHSQTRIRYFITEDDGDKNGEGNLVINQPVNQKLKEDEQIELQLTQVPRHNYIPHLALEMYKLDEAQKYYVPIEFTHLIPRWMSVMLAGCQIMGLLTLVVMFIKKFRERRTTAEGEASDPNDRSVSWPLNN